MKSLFGHLSVLKPYSVRVCIHNNLDPAVIVRLRNRIAPRRYALMSHASLRRRFIHGYTYKTRPSMGSTVWT